MNTTERILTLARRHLGKGMEDSARLALADAIALFDRGDTDNAAKRAVDSLRYSVGVSHTDYAWSWAKVHGQPATYDWHIAVYIPGDPACSMTEQAETADAARQALARRLASTYPGAKLGPTLGKTLV